MEAGVQSGIVMTFVAGLLGIIGHKIVLFIPGNKGDAARDVFHSFALLLVVNAAIISHSQAQFPLIQGVSLGVALIFALMTLACAVRCYRKIRYVLKHPDESA